MKKYFQDVFILRYADGSQKVLSEQQAYKEWEVNNSNPYWPSLHMVQLTPGSQIGLGQQICFNF
jgi:hypothetical protein